MSTLRTARTAVGAGPNGRAHASSDDQRHASDGGFPVGTLASNPPMCPQQPEAELNGDLFRARRESLVDPQHALVCLAWPIDWSRFAAEFGIVPQRVV